MAQAIKTFTSSFTILRIGDRHPNNIMVTEDRQILHRNFRRLFDHDKKKFRINRHCQTTLSTPFPQKSKQVVMFLETRARGKAYAPPRKPANPLTTVFTTMLPTGKFYLALLVSVSKLFTVTHYRKESQRFRASMLLVI